MVKNLFLLHYQGMKQCTHEHSHDSWAELRDLASDEKYDPHCLHNVRTTYWCILWQALSWRIKYKFNVHCKKYPKPENYSTNFDATHLIDSPSNYFEIKRLYLFHHASHDPLYYSQYNFQRPSIHDIGWNPRSSLGERGVRYRKDNSYAEKIAPFTKKALANEGPKPRQNTPLPSWLALVRMQSIIPLYWGGAPPAHWAWSLDFTTSKG